MVPLSLKPSTDFSIVLTSRIKSHVCKALNGLAAPITSVPLSPLLQILSGACRLQALFHFFIISFYIDVSISEILSWEPFMKQSLPSNLPTSILSTSNEAPVYFLCGIYHMCLNLFSGMLSSFPLNGMPWRAGTISVFLTTVSSMFRVLIVSKWSSIYVS